MISSATSPDRLAAYTFRNTPAASPPEYYPNQHRHRANTVDSSEYLARIPTNGSATSYSSTSDLVAHSSPRAQPPGFFAKFFGKRAKVRDAEKTSDGDDPGLEKDDELDGKKPKTRVCQGWQLVVLGSWLNVLIILIPASWVLQIATSDSHTLIFIFCVLSMIPLVRLHDFATTDLSIRLGGSKTGLLNASLANTVEIVVAIIALRKCELRVVQSTLIGTMLSKMLLVLGMCFFAGGLRFSEQGFDATATQIHSSLLSISVGAVIMPAAFHFALSYTDEDAVAAGTTLQKQKIDILQMSHGVAIVLIFIYGAYLLFQFWSHSHFFDDNAVPASDKLPASTGMVATRTMGSVHHRHQQSINPSPIDRIKAKASTASLRGNGTSTPDLSRSNTRSGARSTTPFGSRAYHESQGHKSRSSSEDSTEAMMMAAGGGGSHMKNPSLARNIDAFLISPYASTSQVTVSVSDVPHTAPIQGSTVRLVDPNPHSPSDFRHRRTTSLSTISGASDGRVSPVDEVIAAYLTNGGTEEAAKARRRQHQIVQSSMPYMEKPREPEMSWTLTLILLVFVTVLVAVNAEWLVDSMDHLSPFISKEWIGLILLPTVSAVAECFTAMNVSVKDQLSLSISVAVGSTIQTALFVIPFMVLLGWVLDKPLALLFDPFESLVLYISVNTMGYVVADGRSNWLEGVILVCLYVVIAVTFWFYPGSEFSSNLAVCSTSP
ncbi:hypothetical protein EIP91_003529 [Steccherinum ochraceum]|uniref:Sodium/calcium exchanger membrane region domain-containing protein n=1 Tax=Steccherinum ochraceum TaxID=92696 RepID=A0A4R0S0F4_9APHY|nr:hypothetical protein EIP91_003529 [Steccherinum ochraceum]